MHKNYKAFTSIITKATLVLSLILIGYNSQSQNLITNPCFETDVNNWNIVCPSGEGTRSFLPNNYPSTSTCGTCGTETGHMRFISLNAGNCVRDPQIQYQGCGTYSLCMQACTNGANNGSGFSFSTRFRVGGVNYNSPDSPPLPSTWQTFTFDFITTNGPDDGDCNAQFQIIANDASGHYRFDDISLVYSGPTGDVDCDGVPSTQDCDDCNNTITASNLNDAAMSCLPPKIVMTMTRVIPTPMSMMPTVMASQPLKTVMITILLTQIQM